MSRPATSPRPPAGLIRQRIREARPKPFD